MNQAHRSRAPRSTTLVLPIFGALMVSQLNPRQLRAQIAANSPLSLTIAPSSFSEKAGADAATATLSRSGDVSAPLSVQLLSADTGEATVPSSVSFAAGETSTTFKIAAVDDNVADGTQPVIVDVVSNQGERVATATVSVFDDEAKLSLSFDKSTLSESRRQETATGTITRNTPTQRALTVTLATSPDDRVLAPTTVTIAAGQTAATFRIGVVDDSLPSGTLSVLLTASARGFAPASQSVRVIDDDLKLRFGSIIGAVREGELVRFSIIREAPVTQPLTVTVSSGTPGVITQPTTATIAAGQTEVAVRLPVMADNGVFEGPRTFALTISAPGFVGDSTRFGLYDDAYKLRLTFERDVLIERQSTRATLIRLTLAGQPLVSPNAQDFFVRAAGLQGPNGRLDPFLITIAAGQSSVTFNLRAPDNLDAQPDRSYQIIVDSAAFDFLQASVTASLTVKDDNDPQTLKFYDFGNRALEDGEVNFLIFRHARSQESLAITLSSNDATIPVQTLTFAPDEDFMRATLPAPKNTRPGDTHVVTFTASAPGLAPATEDITILDNDFKLKLTVSPSTVRDDAGRGAVTLIITRTSLDGRPLAAPQALELVLNQSYASFVEPLEATIAAGQSSVTLHLTPNNVDGKVVAQIDAFPIYQPEIAATAMLTIIDAGSAKLAGTLPATFSPVALSRAQGTLDGMQIKLFFSGPLDAQSAAAAAHYRVTAGQSTLSAIESATYEAATNIVVLQLRDRLPRGARVTVAWRDLSDARGQSVRDGQSALTASR